MAISVRGMGVHTLFMFQDGLRILAVVPGSPAANLGIVRGEIVVKGEWIAVNYEGTAACCITHEYGFL